jgi:hypothetical protein
MSICDLALAFALAWRFLPLCGRNHSMQTICDPRLNQWVHDLKYRDRGRVMRSMKRRGSPDERTERGIVHGLWDRERIDDVLKRRESPGGVTPYRLS